MFNNSDLEKMRTSLKAMNGKAEKMAEEAILETTKQAADDMFLAVDRIDTERMKGSVSYITKGGRGKFGWYIGDAIDQDQAVRNRPDSAANHYFVFQEHGFQNVAPMHALLNSFVKARSELLGKVRKMAK